jgi:CheY-like chemotaxis protein
MTGFGSQEDKNRTLRAGFDAHLTKPVELGQLISLLNQALPG